NAGASSNECSMALGGLSPDTCRRGRTRRRNRRVRAGSKLCLAEHASFHFSILRRVFLWMETCGPFDGTSALAIALRHAIGRTSMNRFQKLGIAIGAVALACSGALFQTSGAVAQTWPNRTVTIGVPFGAGSLTDAMARV